MSIRSVAKKTTKRIGRVFGFSEVNDSLNKIQNELSYSLKNINERLDNIETSSKGLEEELRRSEKINELYFDALFKNEDESNLDMRKRFFKRLPPASGDLLLIQQGCIKLLREMDIICKKNSIRYWIADGTLLGAHRHGGMIPWDDDIDVYIMRDELSKLQKAVSGTSFKVNIAYDPFVATKQVRFMSREPNNPCFIDLFAFDYGTKSSQKAWDQWLARRIEIVNKVHTSTDPKMCEWVKRGVINSDEKSSLVDYVKKFFETECRETKEGGAFGLVRNVQKGKKYYMVDGIENIYPTSLPESPRVFDLDEVLPLKTIAFEGRPFPCPGFTEKYLNSMYGDIYSLPKDLVSHYKHIAIDEQKANAIRDFLCD